MVAWRQTHRLSFGKPYIGGNAWSLGASEPCNHRPGRGNLGRWWCVTRPLETCEHPMRRREMFTIVMLHGADDGDLIHQPGMFRHERRKLYAGNGRRNGGNGATNLCRSIGLGIVGFVLRRATVKPDQNDRSLIGRGRGSHGFRLRKCPGLQQICKCKPGKAQDPGLKETSPGQAYAVFIRPAIQVDHQNLQNLGVTSASSTIMNSG